MRWPRPVAVLAAALACYAGLTVPSTVASATVLPITDCTSTSGVIVAVNFTPWNGQIQRSCGADGATGYQLLTQSWNVQGAARDPGFICRIGTTGAMYPTASQDACIVTPPASAYWSYWHADAGQSTWSYTQLGPASYHPKPGSIDYWQYGGTTADGNTGQPTVSPDALRAHPTTPATTSATSAPVAAAQGGTTSGGAGALTPTAGGRRGAAPATTGAPAGQSSAAPKSALTSTVISASAANSTQTPLPGASAAAGTATAETGISTASSKSPTVVDTQPRALVTPSTGSPWATIAVVTLVALAGVLAAVLQWRRRTH